MTRYSIEPRTRKYGNGYGFLSFSKKISNKYRKQLLGTGLYSLKTAFKNLVHKADECFADAEAVTNWYDKKDCENKNY